MSLFIKAILASQKFASLDLGVVSTTVFPNLTPEQINQGHCYNWALAARQYAKKGKIMMDDNHCFLAIDGLYYDASMPQGATDYKQLPVIAQNAQNGYNGEPKTVSRNDVNERVLQKTRSPALDSSQIKRVLPKT